MSVAIFGYAQHMRALSVIPTPDALPEGAEPVANVAPVDPGKIDSALGKVAGAWNTESMNELLTDDYYDKSRFQDAMQTEVPKDARLRMNTFGAVQTLQQMIVDDGGQRVRVSTVSAMANTQVEFNDPKNGSLVVPGTNELIFEVREPVR
ncbi:MAG: hypothetical protein AAF417_19920 [Pseudomonadota bacterium]